MPNLDNILYKIQHMLKAICITSTQITLKNRLFQLAVAGFITLIE